MIGVSRHVGEIVALHTFHILTWGALGICLDDKFNFNDHIDNVSTEAACQASAVQLVTYNLFKTRWRHNRQTSPTTTPTPPITGLCEGPLIRWITLTKGQ